MIPCVHGMMVLAHSMCLCAAAQTMPDPASPPAASAPTSQPASTAPEPAAPGPSTAPVELAALDVLQLRDALIIDRVGHQPRSLTHTDAIEAAIVAGTWAPPQAGTVVVTPDHVQHQWTPAAAGDDGWLHHAALHGGYAHFTVRAPADRIMLLGARGHGLAYVNAEPRAGDPYNLGLLDIPIKLRAGDNSLLLQGTRGQIWARLSAPRASRTLSTADATLPDIVAGRPVDLVGGLVVINATEEAVTRLAISASVNGQPAVVTDVPLIAPLSVRKVVFRMNASAIESQPPDGPRHADLHLELLEGMGPEAAPRPLDAADLKLAVVQPGDPLRRTFISEIDGSVQYFAWRPASPGSAPEAPAPGLLLSLHGASVEASSQASAYSAKPWCHVVAPTNRRKFGFDWEDWGRLDALEVLAIAQREIPHDPARVWLTGHSMGGHGAWSIGATFPDRFAALAPSAGWISFWTYGGAPRHDNPSPVQEILQRSMSSSDTLALAGNCAQPGIYILHGDADDNVPVTQARVMRQHLAGFHSNFAYHERPGAGHWWGDACLDWPPLMSFLQHQRLPAPEEVHHVDFRTADPGVAASCHWATIHRQLRPLMISSINLRRDWAIRTFRGTTSNVAVLGLRLPQPVGSEAIVVELDGQKLAPIAPPSQGEVIWLERAADAWKPSAEPSPASKGPHRSGMFKDVFRRRPILVYGTKGSIEENAWALNKARLDAETFLYRGNGAFDVVADTGFDPNADPERNIVLYGNADTNAAWGALLTDSPAAVRRGAVVVGDRTLAGEDLGALFIRPRPGSQAACVGVVGGSGLAGMRLTDRVPYFVSGVALPDCVVIGCESLATGIDGVRAAGFFGPDWSMTGADFAWKP